MNSGGATYGPEGGIAPAEVKKKKKKKKIYYEGSYPLQELMAPTCLGC
jgi:hypothetical protein